jgi:hypothetical protein
MLGRIQDVRGDFVVVVHLLSFNMLIVIVVDVLMSCWYNGCKDAVIS